jgi:hypothetical protein
MPKKSRHSRKMRMHVPGVPGALTGGRRRRQRGGAGEPPAPPTPAAAPYSDSASYMLSKVGDGNTQWNNVFATQGPVPFGNEIRPLDGNATVQAAIQAGGRRRRGTRRGRRGGFFGNVISQAIVPFGLLALQNKYSRRLKNKRHGTRKHRK